MINDKLRSARRRRFGSLEKAAEGCGVSEKSFRRWEQGQAKPNWESLQCLIQTFDMTAEALGFGDLITDQVTESPPAVAHARDVSEEAFSSHEEEVFLAQLGEKETMTAFDPAKRGTLEKLKRAGGVLAVAHLLQPEPWNALVSSKTTHGEPQLLEEQELHYFGDLVRTCWSLSSAQLQSVEQLLPVFLPSVEHTASQSVPQQRLAANIACQAEQLASIVALHHDDLPAMEVHRQRAVYFGRLSGDNNLYAASIMRLATTYYYLKRAKKGYDTYKQAIPYLERISPLLRSRIYIGLAEAAARCGEVEQALTYRTKAHENFPDHPENDVAALYADGGHFTLALWESLMYMELGEPEEAAASLLLVKQKPALLLPERVRAELTNHEAQATIAQRRLDESAALVQEGVTSALKLGSQKRYSEAYDNYQTMRLLWRHDKRVKNLEELFRH